MGTRDVNRLMSWVVFTYVSERNITCTQSKTDTWEKDSNPLRGPSHNTGVLGTVDLVLQGGDGQSTKTNPCLLWFFDSVEINKVTDVVITRQRHTDSEMTLTLPTRTFVEIKTGEKLRRKYSHKDSLKEYKTVFIQDTNDPTFCVRVI